MVWYAEDAEEGEERRCADDTGLGDDTVGEIGATVQPDEPDPVPDAGRKSRGLA